MRLDLFTLFPEWFEWFLAQRHVRNARERGHRIRFFSPRVKTPLTGGQVDDAPYGGGAGMVMRVDVIDAALEAAYGGGERPGRIVLLTPSGRQFDEPLAAELAAEPEVALICGRYEGVDERVRDHLATDAISIGPYVLSGGEPAAMVVADAMLRKLPGVLGDEMSAVEESFSEALEGAPEYPHYTRPESYRGWTVPEVLLSGDHERIRQWRLDRSRERAEQARGEA
jgi:tRNA (guanine37-N1)-methyltransferase